MLRLGSNAGRFKRLDGEGPDADKLRAMMERQVNHLVRLVDDLLEVSRITRGSIDLKMERLDLSTAIENAVEISQPLIRSNGHKLTVSAPRMNSSWKAIWCASLRFSPNSSTMP